MGERPSGDFLLVGVRHIDTFGGQGGGKFDSVPQTAVFSAGIDHHVPVQERNELVRGCPDRFLRGFCLLQKLVCIQQHLRPECLTGRFPCIPFDPVGQCSRDQGRDQHNDKRNGVFRFIGMKAEGRLNEEPVEKQDTRKRPQSTEKRAHGKNRDHKDAKNENCYDVRFRKPELRKQKPCSRGCCQQQDCDREIPQCRPDLPDGEEALFLLLEVRGGVRDDINIHVRNFQNDLLCQRHPVPDMPSFYPAPAYHKLGRARDMRVLRHLGGDIVTDDRGDRRSVLFSEANVVLKSCPVLFGKRVVICGPDIDRRESRLKGLRHSCRGGNDPRVGRGRRDTDEYVLGSFGIFYHIVHSLTCNTPF